MSAGDGRRHGPGGPLVFVRPWTRLIEHPALGAGLLSALLLALSTALLVTVVWPRERDGALQTWSARLSSVADDRQRAVDRWMRERVGDAQVIGAYPTVRHVLGQQASGDPPFPRDAGPEAHLRSLLEAARVAYAYRAAGVLDATGHLVVAAAKGADFPSPACREVAIRAARSAASTFDLHAHDGAYTFSIAEPVIEPDGGGILGLVVLEMDARDWLYPFLTTETVPTRTGEVLLVAGDSVNVVFLSPLRHTATAPLDMRLSRTTQGLAATSALADGASFGTYRDYRGTAVLAVPRVLERARWGLVVKVDRDEALAEARGHTRQAGFGLALLSLCVSAIAFGAWHRHRRIVTSRLATQSESLARALADLPDVLFLADRDGRIHEVWGDAGRLYGRDAASLRGAHAREVRAPAEAETLDDDLARAWQQDTHRYDARHLHADGRIREVEIATKKVVFDGRELLLAVVRDVSERRLAERRAGFHNRMLRMLSAVNEAMVRASEPGAFLKRACENGVDAGGCAAAWLAWRGAGDEEQIRGTAGAASDLEASAPDVLLAGPVARALRDGVVARAPTTGDDVWHTALRERGVALVVATPVWFEGVVVGAYALGAANPEQLDPTHQAVLDELASDIGFAVASLEGRRREAEANTHIRKLSRAVEQSPSAILITDASGNIEYVNPSFTTITGYAQVEVLGRNPRLLKSGITPDGLYTEMWGTLSAGREWHGEVRNRRKNGEVYWASLTIAPIRDASGAVTHYIALQDDVSAAKQAQAELDSLQQQLTQAHKMEAVGQLAGGIAHDFNNLLGVITGYADFVLRRPELTPDVRHKLDRIVEAGERAAGLTRQLLAFSRRQVLQPRVVEMRAALERSESLLRRVMGEDVTLRFDLEPDLGRVKVDPSQLDQVILNLAVNARDAMPRGGEFRIEAGNVELAQARAHGEPMRPGSYVRVVATDTGVGIETEALRHVFEPFFTTKAADKGTGLGLATVYGIVKQSGGYVWVRSEPGRGTSFRIYLPRVLEPAEGEAPAGPPAARAGGERILLVEDQPALRELIAEMLDTLGYVVVDAGSGKQALERASGQPPFDLLLADVVMPGISGPELARRLTEQQHGLRVLYMSGYAEEVVLRHGVSTTHVVLLPKPFTLEQLAGRLREALGDDTRAPAGQDA